MYAKIQSTDSTGTTAWVYTFMQEHPLGSTHSCRNIRCGLHIRAGIVSYTNIFMQEKPLGSTHSCRNSRLVLYIHAGIALTPIYWCRNNRLGLHIHINCTAFSTESHFFLFEIFPAVHFCRFSPLFLWQWNSFLFLNFIHTALWKLTFGHYLFYAASAYSSVCVKSFLSHGPRLPLTEVNRNAEI